MNGYLHIAGEGNTGPVLDILDAAGLAYGPAAPERTRADVITSLHIKADGWERGDWEAFVHVMQQVLRQRPALRGREPGNRAGSETSPIVPEDGEKGPQ